jgi:hypothetical protein
MLRTVLAGFREAAGAKYDRLLTSAGLPQYLTHEPPNDDSPTLTSDQLSGLYAAAYAVIGESLTRITLYTLGRKTPDAVLCSPSGDRMKVEVQSAPPKDRLALALRLIAEEGSRVWTPIKLVADSEAYYFEVYNCTTCARIRGARDPMCASQQHFYGVVATGLTGTRVSCLEIECGGQGHACCKFRFLK